jgi:hypothetical protein
MYLRHTTITKNGKSHTYWRLVRSVRVGTKVRQETVAQLGELDAAGRVRARALAEAIVGIERQPGLFDEPVPVEPVTVELRRFRLERGRRFGDVWLGWRLWQALHLDTLLDGWLQPGREDVPWLAWKNWGCTSPAPISMGRPSVPPRRAGATPTSWATCSMGN